MNNEWIDHEIKEVIGIDTEVEDRSVGLFGNEFILCLKDKNGQHHSLSFFDEEFEALIKLLMPYFKHLESEKEIEQEIDSEFDSSIEFKKLKGGKKQNGSRRTFK